MCADPREEVYHMGPTKYCAKLGRNRVHMCCTVDLIHHVEQATRVPQRIGANMENIIGKVVRAFTDFVLKLPTRSKLVLWNSNNILLRGTCGALFLAFYRANIYCYY